MYDIFLVGNATMDLIFSGLPRMPILGEDTFADKFEYTPGEAFINAVTMHRLGLKVAWAADFGNDLFSNLILVEVRKAGLSEAYFIHHDHPFRRVSVSASFQDDRGFLTHYDPEPPLSAALKALPCVEAKAIFIPGLIHGLIFDAAVPIVKMKKMQILMDGNCPKEFSHESKSISRALKQVDVFLPNAKEARFLSGYENLEDAARKLSEFCPLVVLKDGEKGALAYDRETMYHLPGITVNPLDTTGAGDCFSSGFVKAWIDAKPIRECLAWGNICGGLSTLGFGGTTFFIDEQVIKVNMAKHYPNIEISSLMI